jgi:hypothetical protein
METMRRARALRGWILFGFALLLLLIFSPQLPDAFFACAPKAGRVVDTTGHGMPNVFVLASAHFDAGPLVHGGSANRSLYNVIVRTDSNGDFAIPAQWSHFTLGLPGTGPTVSWVVTAFSPGLAVTGDEDGWRFDQNGDAFYPAKSTAEAPSASWHGTHLRLQPIVLRAASLSLAEAVAYYRKVLLVGLPDRNHAGPMEDELRRAAYRFFQPLACTSPPDSSVSMRTARYLTMFTISDHASEERLRDIDPPRWQALSYSDALPYSAAEVCDALQAGE